MIILFIFPSPLICHISRISFLFCIALLTTSPLFPIVMTFLSLKFAFPSFHILYGATIQLALNKVCVQFYALVVYLRVVLIQQFDALIRHGYYNGTQTITCLNKTQNKNKSITLSSFIVLFQKHCTASAESSKFCILFHRVIKLLISLHQRCIINKHIIYYVNSMHLMGILFYFFQREIFREKKQTSFIYSLLNLLFLNIYVMMAMLEIQLTIEMDNFRTGNRNSMRIFSGLSPFEVEI